VPALIVAALLGTAVPPVPAQDAPNVKKTGVVTNSLGMKFRDVPGVPVLFSIWETRVADWDAFLRETKYDWDFRPHFPQTGQHPVVNITLRDALAFCNWLTGKEQAAGQITTLQSYRLPSNKEWDAAVGLASGRTLVRGLSEKVSDEKSFPWGTQWPPPRTAANLNFAEITGTEDGFVYTAPVGSFDPSPDGLYDLAGNAWEWAWDQEIRADVVGTLRGGSWMYFRKECLLSSYRYQVPADLRAPSIGFRCVLEDKHSSALYVQAVEKAAREDEERQREALKKHPGVSDEEVKKMREAMNARKTTPSSSPDEAPLPDPKTLKLAQAEHSFINSLGMTFQPAGIKGVLVSAYETRVQDYQMFLESAKRDWNRKPTFEVKPTHPIMNVTWSDATDFCKWLTERERGNKLIPDKAVFRLPTDAEWSAAAGLAGEEGDSPAAKNLKDTFNFPWGRDQWPPPILSANLDTAHMRGYQDSYNYTSPVGSFAPNAFNLYDLAGNVSEWCSDPWPGSSDERVVRGSSWLTSERDAALTSARRHFPSSAAKADVGFRCVLEIPGS
jgi:formylglycine-generating enzyme required for sulfatase activity